MYSFPLNSRLKTFWVRSVCALETLDALYVTHVEPAQRGYTVTAAGVDNGG